MMSRLLRTNVLAIQCLENYIFVGMGYTLYVFNKDSHKLQCQFNCLYPSNIHGIVPGPNNILAVFGAMSMCICDVVKGKETIIFKEQCTDQFNDWIIAVEWISVKGQTELAILFAHNYVQIYNIFNKSSQVISCEEKCILYGGSLSKTSQEDLIVFSGTVFQEILIWGIHNKSNINKSMPVLQRLIGHKGVIFSVIYDSHSRLICSTSDDRTVRLWKVNDNEDFKSYNTNWQTAKIVLVKTLFAHTARVWKAMIEDDIIITIGEDSLICTWSLSGNLLNKVYAHHGAAVWSIQLSKNNRNILTGGADGSVYMWPFTYHKSSKIISLSNIDVHSTPKYISYLNSGTILIFNEKGTLLCYKKEEVTPKSCLYLEKYNTYCIMQVSLCRSFIALASREGYITIYQEISNTNTSYLHQVVEERIMESQIFSLQWLKDDTLIACGANGLLKLFYFTITGTIHVEMQCTLPPSRECWLTAAIIYEQLLICGDRAGNIYVYQLNNINKNVVKPIQTFTKVHGKIGVQSFAVMDEKLITAGRDGMLRFYELNKENKKTLLRLHKKKMPIDWISNILKIDRTIFIFGFKETEFIIYDLLHERILIRVPCGGGHRSWDCTILDGIVNFAYIRNKQVFIYDYPLRSLEQPILQSGFHVKETCCLKRLAKFDAQDIFISGSEDCSLRVSCISKMSGMNTYSFHNLGTFDGHLSGIKCISTVKLVDEIDKLSSRHLIFSGGGRAQLKIWEITLKYNHKSLSNIDVLCSDINCHMLHGQDKHRKKPWQETKQSYIIEPETRYMDICAYYCLQNLNDVLLFVACADGYLRLFVYNIKTNSIYLKVSAKYVDRCILKIDVLSHKNKVVVLTMTTDGIVRFFDFTDAVSKIYKDASSDNQEIENFGNTPFAEFILHQSGINSFDLKLINEGKYLLITGGDDNLLNLLCFQIYISENSNILSSIILSKWSTASIHSAQITGLKFKDGNQICSVGIDQKVVIYDYSWSNETLSAKVSDQIITSVTDVQGMDLWSSDNVETICIYGRGIEVLST